MKSSRRGAKAQTYKEFHTPITLWVGIGCGRGTSKRVMETAIQRICQQHQLPESAIAGIATIAHKADEVGLVELCRDRHWPLRTFSPNVLGSIDVPNPSAAVKANVGTPSVAEAAALCAVLSYRLEGEKIPHLLVPKQIFRLEGQPGTVTVAIAQIEREYIGSTQIN